MTQVMCGAFLRVPCLVHGLLSLLVRMSQDFTEDARIETYLFRLDMNQRCWQPSCDHEGKPENGASLEKVEKKDTDRLKSGTGDLFVPLF